MGEPVRFKLRGCPGHAITVVVDGPRLIALDCPCDLVAVDTEIALGGRPTACWKRVHQVRDFICGQQTAGGVPRWVHECLHDSAESTQRVGIERAANAREWQSTGPVALEARLLSIVERCVHEALDHCQYRRTHARWVGGEHTILVCAAAENPNCRGWSVRVRDQRRTWSGRNSYWEFRPSHGWYTNVYKKGLAVVDGRLILRAIEIGPHKWSVVFVEQSRGFHLVPRVGTVHQRDGQLTLTRGRKFVVSC